jgi:hypothetical protein
MLKWPDKAKRSLAVFFAKWNDFDVFVEDTAQYSGTLYGTFLGRITAPRCKVERVIPLGDRNKVIAAAQQDTVVAGRRRLYLIDGDLDLVSGKVAPAAPKLFSHRVYHIENYFLCEDALIQVLHEENPRLTVKEIKEKLDFSAFSAEIESLRYLFAMFGLTALIAPSLPTISLGIGRFATNNAIDNQKIVAFCNARLLELQAVTSAANISSAQQQVDKAIQSFPTFIDFISAREYILPLLRWWLRVQGLQMPAGKESLLVRLAKVCNFERHTELAEIVKRCATSKTA